MSHIGYDTDRGECACGESWGGVWALTDAADHQRANPQHKMQVWVRV